MAYSEKQKTEIIDRVCEQIAEYKISVREALKLPGMPPGITFYKWIANDENKAKQYARATEERHDGIFEEMLTIADTTQYGTTTKETEKGGVEITTGDMLGHRKLRIDTRKWNLARMNPKKYGDRVMNENYNREVPLTEEELIAERERIRKATNRD